VSDTIPEKLFQDPRRRGRVLEKQLFLKGITSVSDTIPEKLFQDPRRRGRVLEKQLFLNGKS
jgi:hypothetical protein